MREAGSWPSSGRHILAQYDAGTIVVYQAFRSDIGLPAAKSGRFGDGFKLNRMTWIKPNFLWMMYRSGWGTKPDQEVTLAIRLRRDAFDDFLAHAVHSTYLADVYGCEDEWRQRLARSSVRLQWDPDHDPLGRPMARRAIQLGLSQDAVRRFVGDAIIDIDDVSRFVAEQHQHVRAGALAELVTPQEQVYHIGDAAVARRLQVDPAAAE